MTIDTSFASDNAAPVHPTILEAIARANRGSALAYGNDTWTADAKARFRATFDDVAEILIVWNGTAANVLALRCVTDSYHAVICAETSHLWRDECNAPESFTRAKLVPVSSADGKLTPALVRPLLRGFGGVHHAQPRVISVAQPTEWGTVYTLAELEELAMLAHENDMAFHVDGARLANAAESLGVPLGALGSRCGIDVLSFGGTKLGLLGADAVVIFDPSAIGAARFYRKQAMQLASKMRFIAAQLDALLTDDLWRELAAHANAMAARLGAGLSALAQVEVVRPVQTNAVFVRMPPAMIAGLQQQFFFHVWDQHESIARLMTAWDTPAQRVDQFVAAAAQTIG